MNFKDIFKTKRPTRSTTDISGNLVCGFTLFELLVSVSLFVILATLSVGSLVSVFDSNRRAENMQIVMANLDIVLEKMTRKIKFGSKYHCGDIGDKEDPRDCLNGEDYFHFLNSDNENHAFRLENGVVEEAVGSIVNSNFVPITDSSSLTIQNLQFFVSGTDTVDGLQPLVIMVIAGTIGTGDSRADFNLQTSVSQRNLDG